MVLEKTLESPLDCKEIQPVHPKGNQSWIFIGRTDVEDETPILWPSDVKNWLIWKDPDAGKDWRQEENGMSEDEMVGWHHWLNRHEFEQALGVGDGQGSLVCCSPWGHKESDMTEQLNWSLIIIDTKHTQQTWANWIKRFINRIRQHDQDGHSTNKDLLYSTWNFAQCYVSAWMDRNLEENGYMCVYGWVPLLLPWNYHNIVNWLYPNTKLEKKMAAHSSTLAWKIPRMEEPGRLQSMGSLRVGHDWVTSLSLFTFMHWWRKWQPTPVFLPGES